MSQHSTRAFLSFTLGGLEYGLDARQVLELCRSMHSNGLPMRAAWCRAWPAPTVCMVRMASSCRSSTCAPPSPVHAALPSAPSYVIVLTLAHCVIGMVVEAVHGTVDLRPDQIRALPCSEGATPADYLIGLGKVGARRLILVDIDKLMNVGQHKAGCLV